MLHEYFTPCFRIIFYFTNIIIALYKRSIIVKKLHWMLWYVKVIWLSITEVGTGVLKQVGVEILLLYFTQIVHFVGK
jgi:hypothetical protein